MEVMLIAISKVDWRRIKKLGLVCQLVDYWNSPGQCSRGLDGADSTEIGMETTMNMFIRDIEE